MATGVNASEHFDTRGRVVMLWRIRAQELRDAAVVLWHAGTIPTGDLYGYQAEHYRPAQLLMGLALEVGLKGALVARDPSLVADGQLGQSLSTHSLEKLFVAACLPLADGDDELNFARKLSDAVEWVAKYPIPKTGAHLIKPKHKSEKVLVRNSRDLERFEILWARVQGLYGTEE